MSASQLRICEPCVATSSITAWSAPWHARLKNLAETLRPELVDHAGAAWKAACAQAVSGASASWMGRARDRAKLMPASV